MRTRPCVRPLRFSFQRSPRTGYKKVSVGVGKRENLARSVTVNNKSRETKQLRNSKGKKTSYSAKTYNDQTEKIDNLEKKFAKLELKFEENNNIFEKKLEQIVQRFTTELNTMVAQINLSFSFLMNTMESSLKKLAPNITIPKDDDFLIN
ncbi:hypothetical protein TNCV_816741 [Trichonephila clavipes]|nr:hypothetical protein TNCV_816741 [Trichonephila clavipes]